MGPVVLDEMDLRVAGSGQPFGWEPLCKPGHFNGILRA